MGLQDRLRLIRNQLLLFIKLCDLLTAIVAQLLVCIGKFTKVGLTTHLLDVELLCTV